jgi:two-component system sensor histidine kinase KdpD
MSFPKNLSPTKFEVRWPAILIWSVAWVCLWFLQDQLSLGNLALLLIMTSAIAGVWLSAFASIICSAISVLMFNWYFVEPRYTFSVHFQQDMLLLVAMMAVSSVVSYLMARLRLAADLESQHAQTSESLRNFGEKLRETLNVIEKGHLLQTLIAKNVEAEVSILILEDAGSEKNKQNSRLLGTAQGQDIDGLWACIKEFRAIGPGTGRYETQTTIFFPLRGRLRAFGAVALHLPESKLITQLQHNTAQEACDMLGLEIERTQILELAQQAKEDAQSHSLRNTLLTSISHDYRTPLANLMGAASVIQQQVSRLSDEKIAELAQTVLDEAQHLNRMTSNTLQLARLDAAPLLIKKDWESIQEILGAVMAKARQRYPLREISVNVPDGLPLIYCDAILIVQLFDNLIDNANQYSSDGKEIEITVKEKNKALEIRVIDQGSGIDDAWKEKVFHAFERVHSYAGQIDATDSAVLRRGMGVGLAVCKAIAKVHDAKLWIEDNQPTGTVVCLSLFIEQQPSAILEAS